MRQRILGILTIIISASAMLVATAAPSHADNDTDPLCYTTRSTVDSSAYSGPSASRIYDWTDSSQTSQRMRKDVAIPANLISDHYVPQGITGIPNWLGGTEDLLLISAYKDADGDGETDGASAIFGVIANGSRAGQGMGRMLIAEGHVGGIALVGSYVYVGSGNEIRGYQKSTVVSVINAANNSTVYARDYNYSASYTVAYLGSGDGHLWAGSFNETDPTHLNAYSVTNSSTGAISYQFQYYAPKKTQGVAVTGGHVIFATSYGRHDRGNLWIMEHGQSSLFDGNSTCFRTPTMIEGLTILEGRFYASFESGAYTYTHTHTTDDPDNPIYNLHGAPLSWIEGLFMNVAD